jgi:hypothetical protein
LIPVEGAEGEDNGEIWVVEGVGMMFANFFAGMGKNSTFAFGKEAQGVVLKWNND